MHEQPVAIITGAGGGIGRAAAVAFAGAGYALVLAGRRPGPLAETAACVQGAEVASADVGDAGACRDLVERAVARFGRLDVLVNNAGSAPVKPIEACDPATIDHAFRVNALGPAYLIHHAWPVFVRQRRGCVVNVSSLATVDPFAGFLAYAAAKAAVNLMARSCAKEGKRHNIRAFAVAPGAVETPMLRAFASEKMLPRDRCLAPEAVAAVMLACARGDHDAENGGTILVPGP